MSSKLYQIKANRIPKGRCTVNAQTPYKLMNRARGSQSVLSISDDEAMTPLF